MNEQYTITLSKNDLNNLKIFLDRTQLSGKEVVPYSVILKAILEAKPSERAENRKEV